MINYVIYIFISIAELNVFNSSHILFKYTASTNTACATNQISKIEFANNSADREWRKSIEQYPNSQPRFDACNMPQEAKESQKHDEPRESKNIWRRWYLEQLQWCSYPPGKLPIVIYQSFQRIKMHFEINLTGTPSSKINILIFKTRINDEEVEVTLCEDLSKEDGVRLLSPGKSGIKIFRSGDTDKSALRPLKKEMTVFWENQDGSAILAPVAWKNGRYDLEVISMDLEKVEGEWCRWLGFFLKHSGNDQVDFLGAMRFRGREIKFQRSHVSTGVSSEERDGVERKMQKCSIIFGPLHADDEEIIPYILARDGIKKYPSHSSVTIPDYFLKSSVSHEKSKLMTDIFFVKMDISESVNPKSTHRDVFLRRPWKNGKETFLPPHFQDQ